MNIDEMPARRELDALMAERIMGWHTGASRPWSPSGYLPDAWRVVIELTKNYGVSLRLAGPQYADGYTITSGWHATFIEPTYTFTDVGEGAIADTASLAICRAAYKFVEEQ